MKNVKRVVACIMLFGCVVVMQAQDKKEMNEAQRQEFIDGLKADAAKLSLTEEQKAPFMEITRKYGEKMKEVNGNTALSKIDKLKQVKSLRIEKDAEIKALLTEEQFKIYQGIVDERKEKRRERRK